MSGPLPARLTFVLGIRTAPRPGVSMPARSSLPRVSHLALRPDAHENSELPFAWTRLVEVDSVTCRGRTRFSRTLSHSESQGTSHRLAGHRTACTSGWLCA